jgi:thiol-disulfide isomerase/thioredoxin
MEAEVSAATPLSLGQWRWLMVLAAIVGIAWILVSRVPPDAAQRDGATVAPMTGFLAPDFALTSLEGERVQLSALRGSPVIVNFWATWCPPCRAEMPELETVWLEYRDTGLVLLGVDQAENATVVAQFARGAMGVTFPILLDSDLAVRDQYAVRALPTTVFIDAAGRIQDVKVGGPLDKAAIIDGVNKIVTR